MGMRASFAGPSGSISKNGNILQKNRLGLSGFLAKERSFVELHRDKEMAEAVLVGMAMAVDKLGEKLKGKNVEGILGASLKNILGLNSEDNRVAKYEGNDLVVDSPAVKHHFNTLHNSERSLATQVQYNTQRYIVTTAAEDIASDNSYVVQATVNALLKDEV